MAASKENKTQKTRASVKQFIDAIEDETKREDARALDALLRECSGERPAMWGAAMVGYGEYAYKRSDGSAHTYFRTGFSPRKGYLAVYVMPGLSKYEALLAKLGPYKRGASCLYIKRLSDIKLSVLKQILERGYRDMAKLYPA